MLCLSVHSTSVRYCLLFYCGKARQNEDPSSNNLFHLSFENLKFTICFQFISVIFHHQHVKMMVDKTLMLVLHIFYQIMVTIGCCCKSLVYLVNKLNVLVAVSCKDSKPFAQLEEGCACCARVSDDALWYRAQVCVISCV